MEKQQNANTSELETSTSRYYSATEEPQSCYTSVMENPNSPSAVMKTPHNSAIANSSEVGHSFNNQCSSAMENSQGCYSSAVGNLLQDSNYSNSKPQICSTPRSNSRCNSAMEKTHSRCNSVENSQSRNNSAREKSLSRCNSGMEFPQTRCNSAMEKSFSRCNSGMGSSYSRCSSRCSMVDNSQVEVDSNATSPNVWNNLSMLRHLRSPALSQYQDSEVSPVIPHTGLRSLFSAKPHQHQNDSASLDGSQFVSGGSVTSFHGHVKSDLQRLQERPHMTSTPAPSGVPSTDRSSKSLFSSNDFIGSAQSGVPQSLPSGQSGVPQSLPSGQRHLVRGRYGDHDDNDDACSEVSEILCNISQVFRSTQESQSVYVGNTVQDKPKKVFVSPLRPTSGSSRRPPRVIGTVTCVSPNAETMQPLNDSNAETIDESFAEIIHQRRGMQPGYEGPHYNQVYDTGPVSASQETLDMSRHTQNHESVLETTQCQPISHTNPAESHSVSDQDECDITHTSLDESQSLLKAWSGAAGSNLIVSPNVVHSTAHREPGIAQSSLDIGNRKTSCFQSPVLKQAVGRSPHTTSHETFVDSSATIIPESQTSAIHRGNQQLPVAEPQTTKQMQSFVSKPSRIYNSQNSNLFSDDESQNISSRSKDNVFSPIRDLDSIVSQAIQACQEEVDVRNDNPTLDSENPLPYLVHSPALMSSQLTRHGTSDRGSVKTRYSSRSSEAKPTGKQLHLIGSPSNVQVLASQQPSAKANDEEIPTSQKTRNSTRSKSSSGGSCKSDNSTRGSRAPRIDSDKVREKHEQEMSVINSTEKKLVKAEETLRSGGLNNHGLVNVKIQDLEIICFQTPTKQTRPRSREKRAIQQQTGYLQKTLATLQPLLCSLTANHGKENAYIMTLKQTRLRGREKRAIQQQTGYLQDRQKRLLQLFRLHKTLFEQVKTNQDQPRQHSQNEPVPKKAKTDPVTRQMSAEITPKKRGRKKKTVINLCGDESDTSVTSSQATKATTKSDGNKNKLTKITVEPSITPTFHLTEPSIFKADQSKKSWETESRNIAHKKDEFKSPYLLANLNAIMNNKIQVKPVQGPNQMLAQYGGQRTNETAGQYAGILMPVRSTLASAVLQIPTKVTPTVRLPPPGALTTDVLKAIDSAVLSVVPPAGGQTGVPAGSTARTAPATSIVMNEPPASSVGQAVSKVGYLAAAIHQAKAASAASATHKTAADGRREMPRAIAEASLMMSPGSSIDAPVTRPHKPAATQPGKSTGPPQPSAQAAKWVNLTAPIQFPQAPAHTSFSQQSTQVPGSQTQCSQQQTQQLSQSQQPASQSQQTRTPAANEACPDLKDLVAADVLKPGTNVLSIHTQLRTVYGSLTVSGFIQSAGGETFRTPTVWCTAVYGGARFTRKVDAYKRIMYLGVALSEFKLPQKPEPVPAETSATVSLTQPRIDLTTDGANTSSLTVSQSEKPTNGSTLALLLRHCTVRIHQDWEVQPDRGSLPRDYWAEDFKFTDIPRELYDSIDAW